MEPAKSLIEAFGGYEEVARITNRNTVQVRRWEYPRHRGGTDGCIPRKPAEMLLEHSRKKKMGIGPESFFPPAPNPTAASTSAGE